jgi:hypothetical protein
MPDFVADCRSSIAAVFDVDQFHQENDATVLAHSRPNKSHTRSAPEVVSFPLHNQPIPTPDSLWKRKLPVLSQMSTAGQAMCRELPAETECRTRNSANRSRDAASPSTIERSGRDGKTSLEKQPHAK